MTVELDVEGWAIGKFTGGVSRTAWCILLSILLCSNGTWLGEEILSEVFPRKKEAEQDAARQALLFLQQTKARRPQACSQHR